jgi:hypothetical protein
MGNGLRDGYGVLLGTLEEFKRDDPNDFGRFMHGVLTVGAGGHRFRCAVDVDTHNSTIQVHWRVHPLRVGEWAPLLALADGWHPLNSEPASGAVDYIRDPRLADLIFLPDYRERAPIFDFPEPERRAALMPHLKAIQPVARAGLAMAAVGRSVLGRFVQEVAEVRFQTLRGKVALVRPPWNAGDSQQALDDLCAVLKGAVRVAVFGEPFRTGNGVHNIHQNQGDPANTPFAGENEVWQDGLTVAIRADGTASAFMNKFSTQADATDDDGVPV